MWQPPRPHGEPVAGPPVSFLELFYDLVYVAVIAQAAHHLAEHVSARSSVEFAIVFAQMAILVLLAVFTGEAADGSCRAFAMVYAAFLAVVAWLFFTVRRQDRRTDRPDFVTDTGRYVTGMGVATVLIFASAFLPSGPRLIVWAVTAIAWVGSMLLAGRFSLHRGCLQPSPWSSGSGCSRSSSLAKWCSVWSTDCPRRSQMPRRSRPE